MSLRLLVISNYGGATNPIRPEAEIFLALVNKGVRIWVMTPDTSAYTKKLRQAGCTIIDHKPNSKLDLKTIGLIRKCVSENKIQIIHAFNSKAIANSSWSIFFNRSVKLCSYRGYTGNIHWYDPSLYVSFLNPRIDYMVCLAESVREQYLKNGISSERAVTINKGHDPSWYESVQASDLSEFEFPEEAMVCSFVANFRIRMKGVNYLIEAINMLPREMNVYVLMVGDGLKTDSIEKKIQALNIQDRFRFTGFRKDASSLVKASDVSISLSLFGEATQKAMIEAMYLGNPVIMTDIVGNRGMVVHNEGGFIVPPENAKAVSDAMITLYQDKSLRQRMGEKAREHITSFLSIDRSVREYLDFYNKVVRDIS